MPLFLQSDLLKEIEDTKGSAEVLSVEVAMIDFLHCHLDREKTKPFAIGYPSSVVNKTKTLIRKLRKYYNWIKSQTFRNGNQYNE
jgi:hypothetical protein